MSIEQNKDDKEKRIAEAGRENTQDLIQKDLLLDFPDHTCQNVDCNNIGIKVKVKMIMEPDMNEEIHDIWFCRVCINLTNARNGGLKN